MANLVLRDKKTGESLGKTGRAVLAQREADRQQTLNQNSVQNQLTAPVNNSPLNNTPVNPTLDVSKVDVQPINIPQAPTSGINNLAQTTNTQLANIKAQSNTPEPSPLKQQANDLFQKYLTGSQNQAKDEAQIYQDQGYYDLKTQRNALNNEILQFDKDFRDKIKEIRKNTFGGTFAGVQGQIAKATQEYDDQRANKLLAYNIVNDQYNEASQIVTDKVGALRDQLNNELTNYQLISDQIKNDLTDSEQIQLQSQLNIKEQQAQTLENSYSQALEAGTDNKASQSYFNDLDKAKQTGNAGEIANVVARYGYKTLEQQKALAEIGATNALANQRNTANNPADNSYQVNIANRTIDSVDNLIGKAVANPEIFGRSAALPIPDFLRSDAFRNFKAQLETLKANVFTSQLQAMRDASKTGGAVGQVSDKEGDRFANALGAISMSQSPSEIQKQLLVIKDSTNRWLNAVGQGGAVNQTGGKAVTAPNGDQVIITD